MKKFILILSLALMQFTALAWDNCPFNETNCEYPGKCGRYTDSNQDRICDYSQENPALQSIQKNIVLDETNMTLTTKNNLINEEKLEEIKNIQGEKYHLASITIFLILVYLASYILQKNKIINLCNHKKFWNYFLLITFFISGLLGILLVIQINFQIRFALPFNILFWHVEVGIAMAIISMFHIFERWRCFIQIKK